MDNEGDMRVKDLSVEDIKSMPELTLTTPDSYDQKSINNKPEDMERLLNSWDGVDPLEKEVDKEIYGLINSKFWEPYVPGVFNPEFKELKDSELTNMEFADEVMKILFRIGLRDNLDDKINNDITGFVGNDIYYRSIKTLFKTEDIRPYLNDVRMSEDDYNFYIDDIDEQLGEAFNNLLNLTHLKVKSMKGGNKDLEKLAIEQDIVKDVIDQTYLWLGLILHTHPEMRDCFEIHLKESERERAYAERFSSESVRKIKFWRDFVESGYSEEKSKNELSFRRGI